MNMTLCMFIVNNVILKMQKESPQVELFAFKRRHMMYQPIISEIAAETQHQYGMGKKYLQQINFTVNLNQSYTFTSINVTFLQDSFYTRELSGLYFSIHNCCHEFMSFEQKLFRLQAFLLHEFSLKMCKSFIFMYRICIRSSVR